MRALISDLPNKKEMAPSMVPEIETAIAKRTQKMEDQPALFAVNVVTTNDAIRRSIEAQKCRPRKNFCLWAVFKYVWMHSIMVS